MSESVSPRVTECSVCKAEFLAADEGCQKCGSPRANAEVAAAPDANTDVRYAQTLDALRKPRRGLGAKWFWLSLVAYGLAVGWGNWESLIVLIPVLLIHELGHFAAMRAFGQSDARIFFLPFFGAVTTSRIGNEHAWQRAVVLLAGPVPGILLGAVLMQGGELWGALGAIFIVINALNLLPFAFLDGGRLVTTLFRSHSGTLETAISIVPGIGVGIYALTQRDYLLMFVCYTAIVSGLTQRTTARVANNIPGEFPSRIEDCSDEQLRQLYAGVAKHLTPARAADTMRALHERKRVRLPSAAQRTALVGAYLGSLALACGALWS
jgi:Zn-dependent protease